MKKLLATFPLILILSSFSFAQFQLSWEQTFDNGFLMEELTHSVIDSDNNIIVVGKSYTQSLETTAILIKYSPSGDQIWWKFYTYGNETIPIGLHTDGNDNIYLGCTGRSEDTNWKSKFRLIKYDKDGQQLSVTERDFMCNFWFGEENLLGSATQMFRDKFSRFVLGGEAYGNSWITILDEDGTVITQTHDTLTVDPVYPYFEEEVTHFDYNTGYIYTGFKRHDYVNAQLEKFCILKQDADGEILWDKDIYDFGQAEHYAWITSLTTNYGAEPTFVLFTSGGSIFSGEIIDKPHILKLNNDGEMLWDVPLFSEPGEEYNSDLRASVKDDAGNIFVTGERNNQYVLYKFTDAGQMLWEVADLDLMQGRAIVSDGNNAFVAIADVHGNVFIHKYDWQGNLLAEYEIEGVNEYAPTEIVSLMLDPDKNVVFTGHKKIGSSYDFLVVKLSDESVSSIEQDIPDNYTLSQNYPNPFNPETTIRFTLPVRSYVKIALFDVLGNVISILTDSEYSAGEQSIIYNAAELTSGIYFYKIETGNFSDVKKMILLK